MFLFAVCSTILIALDVLTKKYAVSALVSGNEIVVIPGFLRLIYLENTGAAFGILPGMRWFLVAVAAVVMLIVLWYVWSERCRSRWQYYGFIFIFAGALGNFINRLFLGYVIDFINVPRWPTFNLADVFINVGVLLLIMYILRQSDETN